MNDSRTSDPAYLEPDSRTTYPKNYEDKTDDRKETGGAAFPGNYFFPVDVPGMSLRSYAAIHLRIPESGIGWLDEMIAKSERRDLAIKAFQAICSFKDAEGMELYNIRNNAHKQAEAMIAERTKEK